MAIATHLLFCFLIGLTHSQSNLNLDESIDWQSWWNALGIETGWDEPDTDKNAFTPSITLYGERHNRERCIDTKAKLIKQANEGEFVLCLEGLSFYPLWNHSASNQIPYINGIEYSVAHFASVLLLKRIDLEKLLSNSRRGLSVPEVKARYVDAFKARYIYVGSIVYQTINAVFDTMYDQLTDEFVYKSLRYLRGQGVPGNRIPFERRKIYKKDILNEILNMVDNFRTIISPQSTTEEKIISYNTLVDEHVKVFQRFAELFTFFLMQSDRLQLENNHYDNFRKLIDLPTDRCSDTTISDYIEGEPMIFQKNEYIEGKFKRGGIVFWGYKVARKYDWNPLPLYNNDERLMWPSGDVFSSCRNGLNYRVMDYFLDKLAINYRDPFMAKSISQCYLNAAHRSKDLKVIVGDAHVSDDSKLLHLLQKELRQLQIDVTVKIVRLKQHCPEYNATQYYFQSILNGDQRTKMKQRYNMDEILKPNVGAKYVDVKEYGSKGSETLWYMWEPPQESKISKIKYNYDLNANIKSQINTFVQS